MSDKPRAAQWLRAREAARRSARVHQQITAFASIPGMRLQRSRTAPPHKRARTWHTSRFDGPYDTGMPRHSRFHRCSRSFLEQGRTARLRSSKATLLFTTVPRGVARALPAIPHANRAPDRSHACLSATRLLKGGTLRGRDDVGIRARRPEPRAAYRPDRGRADARCAPAFSDRSAHGRNDGASSPSRCFASRPIRIRANATSTGRTRYIRSGLSQLHDGQAHDQEAPPRLDRVAWRAKLVERIPRHFPLLRRSADSARSRSDAQRNQQRWSAVLGPVHPSGNLTLKRCANPCPGIDRLHQMPIDARGDELRRLQG